MASCGSTAPLPRGYRCPLSLEQLKDLLRRENDMRLSEKTQKIYASLEDRYDKDWQDATAELQEELVTEFLTELLRTLQKVRTEKKKVRAEQKNKARGRKRKQEEKDDEDEYQEEAPTPTREHVKDVLLQLRRAQYDYPNDEDIKNIPLYVKYNRARRGNLKPGDLAPDVPLVAYTITTGGKAQLAPTTLWAQNTKSDRPMVVMAGSYT